MPRVGRSGTSPDWNRLFELASPQAGYFTNGQAREAGYSLPLLQFHIDSGRLARAPGLRGVLRLVHYPAATRRSSSPTGSGRRRPACSVTRRR